MAEWKDVLVEFGADETFNAEQLKEWFVQQKAGAAAAPVTLTPHPRLPVFSGEKGDSSSFAQFKNEVLCLLRDEREASVMSALRRALRGPAGEVLFRMGEVTQVKEVLKKLEIVFGEVKSAEQLLESFYAARQYPKESVAEWGCRLEDIVNRLKDRKAVQNDAVDSMLRTKFWSGLASSHIKMALRHHFDQNKPYVDLLSSARATEVESASSSTQSRHQEVDDSVNKLTSKLDLIMSRLDSMENRLGTLETSRAERGGGGKGRTITCFKCGEKGHVAKQCQRKGNGEGPAPGGGRLGPTAATPH